MARILVIEDDAASLDLIRYLLETFGHTILTAGDGEEGLEAVRRQMPDLILCDVRLPRMDGYEVAHQLKSHPAFCTIPLVAVTAYAMVGDRDKMLRAGFDGYIPKPIVPETFVKQVEGFLRADPSWEPVELLREMAGRGALLPSPSAGHATLLRLKGSLAKVVCDLVREWVRELIWARDVHPQILDRRAFTGT